MHWLINIKLVMNGSEDKIYIIYNAGPFSQLTYIAIGDGAATAFFDVNPADGVITVKQDLAAENEEFFNVSQICYLLITRKCVS